MASTSRSICIARPAEVVAAQFADVGHHERTGVHSSTEFELIVEDGDDVHYRQRSVIAGRSVTQTMRLDRSDPLHLVNRVVDGPLAGGAIVFDVRPVDSGSSEVTATLRLPEQFRFRIVGPLLLRIAARDLAAALEEDRADLEHGGYTPRSESADNV